MGKKVIKEVREYKYLVFTFQGNGEIDALIKEKARKVGVMREVCGIGKRWFRGEGRQ